MSPPNGVIPFLSPIPNTDVSICVAPASRAKQTQGLVSHFLGVPKKKVSTHTGVCVGNGTSSVIVKMAFDITANDSSQGADQLVDLSGIGTPNSISNAYTIHAKLKYGFV